LSPTLGFDGEAGAVPRLELKRRKGGGGGRQWAQGEQEVTSPTTTGNEERERKEKSEKSSDLEGKNRSVKADAKRQTNIDENNRVRGKGSTLTLSLAEDHQDILAKQATCSPDPRGGTSAVAQTSVLGLEFDPNHTTVILSERARQEEVVKLFMYVSIGGGWSSGCRWEKH
jgi:hypothetical protein